MLGVLLITAGLALGQVEAPPNPELQSSELAKKVERLERMLGADTLQDREAAEKKLLELGPAVLPYLSIPNPRMSAEQRGRIQKIGDALRLKQAVASTSGTTVTLDVEKTKLSAVLKMIEEQTGNRFVDYEEHAAEEKADPEITLAVEGVPFWQAVDQVAAQAKLAIKPYVTDEGDQVVPGVALVDRSTDGSWRSEFVAYDGAFRFEAVRMRARRGLRESDVNRLELFLEAAWEPRLTPIAATVNFDSFSAKVDEGGLLGGGESELPVTRRGKLALDVFEQSSEFPVHLALPSRDAKQIKSIRGTISALLPGRIETFRFERLATAKDVRQRVGDVTVVLNEVRKNQALWEVRIRVQFQDDAGALESHLASWVSTNDIYLQSLDGKRQQMADAVDDPDAVTTQTGAGYFFVLEDDDSIDNYRLIYRTPGALVKRDVTFEFKDLPLP